MDSASGDVHSDFSLTAAQSGSCERQEHADINGTDRQPAENSSMQHKLSQHEPQPEALLDSHADRASVISYDRNFLLSLRFSSLSTAPPQKLLEDGSFPAELLHITRMPEYDANGGTSSKATVAQFSPSSGYVKQYIKKNLNSTKAVRVRSSSASSADGCVQTERNDKEERLENVGCSSASLPYRHSTIDDLSTSLALRELQRSENAHALVTYLVLAALRRSAQEQVFVELLILELVRSRVVRPECHQKGFLEAAVIVLTTAADNPAMWARFAVLLAATVPHDLRQQWCPQQQEFADVAVSSESQESCNAAVDITCNLRSLHTGEDTCEATRCNDANSSHVPLTKGDVLLSGSEPVMRSSPYSIGGKLLENSRDVNGEKNVSSQQNSPKDAHNQRPNQAEHSCSAAGAVLTKQSFREPADEACPQSAAPQPSESFQERATPPKRQNVASRLMKQFHIQS